MEHRWGERRPIGLKVQLIGGGSCIGPAWLRNASLSGGFLETDMRLPVLACVAVEVRLDSGTGINTWEIQACVVRVDDDGIGVEWQELVPVVTRLLLPWVGTSAVDPPPSTESVRQLADVSKQIALLQGNARSDLRIRTGT